MNIDLINELDNGRINIELYAGFGLVHGMVNVLLQMMKYSLFWLLPTFSVGWQQRKHEKIWLGTRYQHKQFLFSREHATLQLALSVGRSVYRRLRTVLGCLLLPNCLAGFFYHYPCPPARDLGSRVSIFENLSPTTIKKGSPWFLNRSKQRLNLYYSLFLFPSSTRAKREMACQKLIFMTITRSILGVWGNAFQFLFCWFCSQSRFFLTSDLNCLLRPGATISQGLNLRFGIHGNLVGEFRGSEIMALSSHFFSVV